MTTFSLQTQEQVQSIPSAASVKEQLLSYEFPSGFAERLAHEHDWTLPFALEVLSEYRRFLVLAATSGQSVTPSQTVDAAWHEHLTHTRDYWLRLTPLLPTPLHHDPSSGSATDAAHFAQQYLGTLALYRAEFGNPNPQIWPDPRLSEPGLPAPRTPTPQRRLPRWLLLTALWLLGGLALYKFGFWAVAGLTLLGFIVAANLSSSSKKRSRGNTDGGDGGGFFGLVGDFGASRDASCSDNGSDSSNAGSCDSGSGDSGGSDGGSSCGSSCGSGCNS